MKFLRSLFLTCASIALGLAVGVYLTTNVTAIDKKLLILKIISVIIIVFSSVVSSSTIWQIVNIFTALLAIINIYALICLEYKIS